MNDKREYRDDELDDIYEKIVDVESKSQAPEIQGARRLLDLLNRAGPNCEPVETVHNLDTAKNLDSGAVELHLPLKIDRFEVKRKIGQGGFGMVLLAKDPDLQRDVAIKIPRADAFATQELRERFLREGRIAASLAHRGIVPVFESGQIGPVCYIASQFVSGSTLEDFVNENGTLNPNQSAAIVAELAEAIGHAHQRGVLHRDLKPSNVLISDENQNESISARVRITDFGLAKMRFDSQQTQTGSLIGTPTYMSPEQTRNEKKLGPATDIYSLGAMLYRLLSGAPPFSEETVIDTLNAVRSKEPKSLVGRVPGVNKDLDAICLKCLEKEPGRRYGDALKLQADLQRYLNHEPVCARHVSWIDRSVRWFQRNPVVGTLAATTILSLSVGLIVAMNLYGKSSNLYEESQTRLAKIQEQEKTTKRQLEQIEKEQKLTDKSLRQAEQTIDKMLKTFSDELKNLPGTKELRQKLLQEALDLQLDMFNTHRKNPRVVMRTLTAFNSIATFQTQMHLRDDAIATRNKGLEIYETLSVDIRQSNEALLAKALLLRNNAKFVSQDTGNDHEAIQMLNDAIETLRSISQPDELTEFNLGQCYQTRGKIYFLQSDWVPAFEDLQQALNIFEANDTVDPRSRLVLAVQTRREVAWVQFEMGRQEESILALNQCLIDAQKAVAQHPSDVDLHQLLLQVLNYRITYFLRTRDNQRAIDEYGKMILAAESQTSKVPDEYVFWNYLLNAKTGIVDAKFRAGIEVTDEELNEVASLGGSIIESFGDSNSNFATLANFCSNASNQLLQKKRFEQAEKFSDRGLAFYDSLTEEYQSRPRTKIDAASQYGIRGKLEYSRDRFQESINWFEKELAICEELSNAASLPTTSVEPHYCFAVDHLVFCHYRMGQHEKAKNYASELIEFCENRPLALLLASEYIGYVIEHIRGSELTAAAKTELLEIYLEHARRYFEQAVTLDSDLETNRTKAPFSSFLN